MYKLSLNNELFYTGDGSLFVFNHTSGNILKTSDKSICAFFSGRAELKNISDSVAQRLKKDGFLVPKDADEDSLNYLLDFDQLAMNELKLIILPTYNCNFRCTYCYQDFKETTMDGEFVNRIIKYVKREIHKYSGLNVGWYGGEPLLCVDIINKLSREFIDICHSVNRKYSAAITTNGYLLTKNVFEQMKKNHIILYQITLDGLKEVHDRDRKLIKGEGTFDYIIKNLKEISSQKGGGFRIQIRSNMQPNRINEYNEFLKFLWKNFGRDKRFRYWFTAVSNYGGDSIQKMEPLLDSFDDIYDLLISSDYNLDYSPYYYHLTARNCIASARNCYIIAPDCSLLKCTIGLDQDANKIGYITEKGEAVYDYYKLAKWIHYKRDVKSKCTKCIMGKSCLNFACPKINNFPDEGLDCTRNYINNEKIVRLLCKGHYEFIKEY